MNVSGIVLGNVLGIFGDALGMFQGCFCTHALRRVSRLNKYLTVNQILRAHSFSNP